MCIRDSEDGEKLSFDKFYSVESNPIKVDEKKIVKFLSNLGLNPKKIGRAHV